VHPSGSGNLLYRHDAQGVRICDFSDCGYKGGAQELPDARIAVTDPDPGTSFPTNQPITLEANVENTEGDLLRVEFYHYTNQLGIAYTPPYRVT
jgi:Bacterial Ig domain